MRILPILFNTEMVRGIMEGRKSVTRRVLNFPEGCNPQWTGYVADGSVLYGSNNIPVAKCPYKPRDILYVRETWAEGAEGYAYKADFEDSDGWGWRPSIHMPKEAARIFLRVKDVRVERLQDSFFAPISPIFALQAEGMGIGDDCRECIATYGNPCCIDNGDDECGILDEIRGEFSELWDSTVKKGDWDKYGWAANPWVWVIEFERIDNPGVGQW